MAKSVKGRNIKTMKTNETEKHLEVTNSTNNLNPIPLPSWEPSTSKRSRKSNCIDIYQELQLARSYLFDLFDSRYLSYHLKYYCGPLICPNQNIFYETRICLSTDKSINICLDTHCQSNDIWRKERRTRITASECYDLYTYYVNDDGNRDWTKKLSAIIHPLEKRYSPLLYGKEMEIKALQCFRRNNPNQTVIRMGLVIPPSIPYLGCSPDAVVLNELKLIEIKCPISGKTLPISSVVDGLKWIEKKDNVLHLRKKHSYYGQIQMGMYLLNLQKADLVVYSSFDDNYISIDVPYDAEFIARIIPVLQNIYFNVFLPLICAE